MEVSVASLHEASAAAAFGAGNLDVESALGDFFDGVGGDGLQVFQGYGLLFGIAGVLVCGVDVIGSILGDSVVLLFVLEIELSFFIRNLFLDFGEVGSVISWILIVKIFLFPRLILNLRLMIVVFRHGLYGFFCCDYGRFTYISVINPCNPCLIYVLGYWFHFLANLFHAAESEGLGGASFGIRICLMVPSLFLTS